MSALDGPECAIQTKPMRLVPKFFTRLDSSARRALLVTLGLFGLVGAVFLLGKTGAIGDIDALQTTLQDSADSPWGLAILIAIFCLAAFLGVPQFGLIAAAVVAFGPVLGFGYSWVATMISGSVTFWIGRFAGEDTFRRYAGNMANRMASFIGRNAFAASAIVRNVPTGPFVVVNMAFGVSTARYSHFLAGMALGILPKIALVAFAGQSLMAALRGSPWIAALAALAAAAVWIGLMLYARRRMRGQTATQGQNIPSAHDNSIDSERDPAK